MGLLSLRSEPFFVFVFELGIGRSRGASSRGPPPGPRGGFRGPELGRKPFIGFGAMDVARSYQFIWFVDIHGPNPP